MKHPFLFACVIATLALCIAPTALVAGPADTLVVYATTGASLDAVVSADTLAGGLQKHTVYKLPSRDTTYIFLGSITLKTSVTILGVLGPNGRPPCIQPGVLPDNSVPPTPFVLTGKGTKVTLKNLYLLAAATNNTLNGGGVAVQISADSIALVSDNIVYDGWQTFAIGYNGNYDKFLITNCRFRNMVHPNQWYIGEVLRNEWPGEAFTDSVIFRNNTMLCINGYASGTVTKYYQKYFEFTHNTVIYTFKNPFFEFNVTDAKFNNNIFFGLHAGGVSKAEYPWWDQLWSPEVSSVIDLDTLNLAKDTVFNPADMASPNHRMLSEAKRKVEVKNNAWFWPTGLTSFWTAWNDTAHTDSIYTPSWMNARTQGFFNNKTVWPNFTASGNVNADPGFGAGVGNVLNNTGGGNGIGLLPWFAQIRRGTALTDVWGYKLTQVGSAVNWVPTWPLPEAADMVYSNAALKTAATDGKPIGDYTWSGLTGVEESAPGVPTAFALSEAYPNPFNPSTNIEISLPSASNVSLRVFNLLGQEVASLASGNMSAGKHIFTFNANNLSSGVYFYTLTADKFVSTRKMMLMK
jgi:hypothetical protein